MYNDKVFSLMDDPKRVIDYSEKMKRNSIRQFVPISEIYSKDKK